MLPGRKYTPEDLVDILRRRVWLLLVPFAVVSAATALFARSLPDLYEARALISVVPQQVPASIVPTTTTRLSDRVQAIQDRVLSRPRLEKLILELNLYPEERRTGIMQDIVERMKTRDLRIAQNGPVAYRVSYFGREPVSTMRVVQEVAGAFIDESLTDRQAQANQTNAFLESATENARLKLVDREQRLAAYKLQYAGELPTQQDANLRQMGNISNQLQSIAVATNTARQRQLQFERELLTAEQTPATEDLAVSSTAAGARGAAGPPSSTAQSLVDARRQLNALSAKYHALHPDVERWTAVVADLEAKAAAEGTTAGGGLPPGLSPAEALRQRQINELRAQVAALKQELAGYAAEEQRLRNDFAFHKARVEAAPKRESELTELLRDYDEINTSYSGLRLKSEQAALAANLQQREIGEQFKLLEGATVPQRPSSPNRQRIAVIGMVVGFAFGIALIGLLEYRDSAFKTDKQVTALLGLPVLAVVPVMQSAVERRRALIWRTLLHVGLGGTVAGCLAVLGYTFLR